MSREFTGGGQRAHVDKEFFPQMNESEVVKAKTLASGIKIYKKQRENASDAQTSKRSSERKAKRNVKAQKKSARSLSASLLLSASTASTIPLASSSSSEDGIPSIATASTAKDVKAQRAPVPLFNSFKDALIGRSTIPTTVTLTINRINDNKSSSDETAEKQTSKVHITTDIEAEKQAPASCASYQQKQSGYCGQGPALGRRPRRRRAGQRP